MNTRKSNSRISKLYCAPENNIKPHRAFSVKRASLSKRVLQQRNLFVVGLCLFVHSKQASKLIKPE